MGRKSKPAIGGRGVLSLGHEAYYGKMVTPTHVIGFTNETLTNVEDELDSATITGNRGKEHLDKGGETISGDISFEQSPDAQLPLIYHALGSYVKAQNVDGGVRGITARSAKKVIAAVDSAVAREIIILRDDTSATFDPDGGLFSIVSHDANRDLLYDDNAAAGFAFDGYAMSDTSHVRTTSVNAADITYVGYTATPVVSIVLEPKTMSDGVVENPLFCAKGGVLRVGAARREIPYFQAIALPPVGGVPNGVRFFLDPTVAIPATAPTHPVDGDFVWSMASMVAETAFDAGMPVLAPGQFFLDYSTDYTDVNLVSAWTHFFERAYTLPEGFTAEAHRDAIVFTYPGSKIATFSVDMQAKSYLTGSFGLVCQREVSVATLLEDVIPGAATITVTGASSFPATGKLRIGDETGMSYTNIVDNGDGTYNIAMATTLTSNVDAIQRHHMATENVDPMSSNLVTDPYVGYSKLMTTMNIFVYVQGYFEEVMAASFSLDNGLATDKSGLGNYTIFAAPEGEAMVEGNLTFEFDDGINYNRYLTAKTFSIDFKGISNAVDARIGATMVKKQIHYYLPNCKLGGTTPNIADKNYIKMEGPFKAAEDKEGGLSDLYCIVVNDQEFSVMN